MPQSECESLPQPCARASLILVKAMRDGRSWMLVVGVECAGVTVHHAMFWHSNFIFMENRAALELLGIYACAAPALPCNRSSASMHYGLWYTGLVA